MKYPKYCALLAFAEKLVYESNTLRPDEMLSDINSVITRVSNNPYDLIGMNIFVKMNYRNMSIIDEIADDSFHEYIMKQDSLDDDFDMFCDDFDIAPIHINKPRYILNIDSWGVYRDNYLDPISSIERDVNNFYIDRISEMYSDVYKEVAIDLEFFKIFIDVLSIVYRAYYDMCGIDVIVSFCGKKYNLLSFLDLLFDNTIDITSTHIIDIGINFESLNSDNETKANTYEDFSDFIKNVESVDDILKHDELFRKDQ